MEVLMFNFDWNQFRAKLMMNGLTIKDWCKDNGLDLDRYRNIQQGKVNPSDDEIKLFKSVMGGE
jgi:hypothetical protein